MFNFAITVFISLTAWVFVCFCFFTLSVANFLSDIFKRVSFKYSKISDLHFYVYKKFSDFRTNIRGCISKKVLEAQFLGFYICMKGLENNSLQSSTDSTESAESTGWTVVNAAGAVVVGLGAAYTLYRLFFRGRRALNESHDSNALNGDSVLNINYEVQGIVENHQLQDLPEVQAEQLNLPELQAQALAQADAWALVEALAEAEDPGHAIALAIAQGLAEAPLDVLANGQGLAQLEALINADALAQAQFLAEAQALGQAWPDA